jgi:hypothetical protein
MPMVQRAPEAVQMPPAPPQQGCMRPPARHAHVLARAVHAHAQATTAATAAAGLTAGAAVCRSRSSRRCCRCWRDSSSVPCRRTGRRRRHRRPRCRSCRRWPCRRRREGWCCRRFRWRRRCRGSGAVVLPPLPVVLPPLPVVLPPVPVVLPPSPPEPDDEPSSVSIACLAPPQLEAPRARARAHRPPSPVSPAAESQPFLPLFVPSLRSLMIGLLFFVAGSRGPVQSLPGLT